MNVQGFDHHIKREIFYQLRKHDIARYSDLVIKTVEPSQFMYHLKDLIRMGLVEKIDKGKYRLTNSGIRASQAFSSFSKNITESPMTYTLIFARSNKGRWLVLERYKQPYINKLGCISGKVHMEETLQEALEREWNDFIGQPFIQPEYKGQLSVLVREGANTLTHIAGPIWFADNLEEKWPKTEVAQGKLEWIDWTKLDYSRFIPGWKEIIDKLEDSKPFLLDLEFDT